MIRRARPLLGTVVAICADAPPDALDAAFRAIERVHDRMSAQQAESDISRINREAHYVGVVVDPWTIAVLQAAIGMSEASDGAFDVVMPGTGASYADIEIETQSVRLRRRARLDVSGIAKGFAVDAAVDALQRHGARRGSVNAGGDLRFFGDAPRTVMLRSPGGPLALPPLPYAAYATSSGEYGTTVYDARTGSRARMDWSVTVAAGACVVADALTKAVALLGPLPSLLRRFGATALAVGPDGRLHAPAG